MAEKFKKLPEWESDAVLPILKQVKAFPRAVHVPVGYLFLAESPKEPVPIPDFRTFAGQTARRQQPIGPYIVDFACLPQKLLIELDGGQHAEQHPYDQKRDAFLRAKG